MGSTEKSVGDTHEIHVWVNSWVDVARGQFAAHFQRGGVMAQFDVACGIKITQYQPATRLLLFHL